MDHSCRKIRQPWISFLSDWPLPAISLQLADVCCCSAVGGTSRIGTDTRAKYTEHCFISSGRIRVPASGAPQRQVSYNCQKSPIPLHAIYINIQSALYRTWLSGLSFVKWLVFMLKTPPSSRHVEEKASCGEYYPCCGMMGTLLTCSWTLVSRDPALNKYKRVLPSLLDGQGHLHLQWALGLTRGSQKPLHRGTGGVAWLIPQLMHHCCSGSAVHFRH